MLTHFGRTSCAIQPNDVNSQGFKGVESGSDFRAQQHSASGFDGYLSDQNNVTFGLFDRLTGSIDGSFGLQQILCRFDEQGIRTTCYKTTSRQEIIILEGLIIHMAQGGQLGARAHRTQHETGLALRGVFICDFSRNASPSQSEFIDAIFDSILSQVRQVSPKCVGFNGIYPDI